jgi:MFS family permease
VDGAAGRVGRQKVYLFDIAAFIVLSVLQLFADAPWQLVVLRLALGVAIGADFAIAGTIASEFAPQKSRGPLLVVMVTMWSVGAAVAYVVGWAMLSAGPDAWRWMLASSAIPAALILLLRIGTPESPRWLLSKGRVEEARAVVEQMLGPGADLSDIETDTDAAGRYSDMFRKPYLRRTVFVCVFWACQLLPIYAISTYEPTILHSFGLATGDEAYLGAVVIQVFYVLGSLSGALFVNRGRRKLLLWSFAISTLPLLGLAALDRPSAGALASLATGTLALFEELGCRPTVTDSFSRTDPSSRHARLGGGSPRCGRRSARCCWTCPIGRRAWRPALGPGLWSRTSGASIRTPSWTWTSTRCRPGSCTSATRTSPSHRWAIGCGSPAPWSSTATTTGSTPGGSRPSCGPPGRNWPASTGRTGGTSGSGRGR